jgi:formate hydrogenlyase subunit 4
MSRKEVSPQFRKHLPDLLAGLAVFALMLALTGWHMGIAAASSGSSFAAAMDRNATALLLAGAFAAMAVFNVAFVRHLRRAYSPRKPALPHHARIDKTYGG